MANYYDVLELDDFDITASTVIYLVRVGDTFRINAVSSLVSFNQLQRCPLTNATTYWLVDTKKLLNTQSQNDILFPDEKLTTGLLTAVQVKDFFGIDTSIDQGVPFPGIKQPFVMYLRENYMPSRSSEVLIAVAIIPMLVSSISEVVENIREFLPENVGNVVSVLAVAIGIIVALFNVLSTLVAPQARVIEIHAHHPLFQQSNVVQLQADEGVEELHRGSQENRP